MRIKEKVGSLSRLAKESILKYISEENLQPEDMLPSEASLGEMLGVSRDTVREALALLEQDKIVYKIQGKGTFLNRRAIEVESGLEKLESITEIIEKFGYKPNTIWVSITEEKPTKDMILKMNLKPNEKVITFKRIRTADNKIAVYCIDTVRKPMMSDLPDKIEYESMFNYWKERYGIKPEYAIAEIIPTLPTEEMVSNMNVPRTQLFTLLHQTHYDKEGKPVIYSNDYFNYEVFKFKINRFI